MQILQKFLKNELKLCLILILFLYSGILFLFRNTGLICDEIEHFNQVLNFANGDFRLLEISAMPGYHAVLAFLFKLFGLTTLMAARIINLLIGCISVGIFYLLNRHIRPNTGILRTLQYALFPTVLIYFYVVYTDILSLALVLAMLFFSLEKKYRLGGLLGILSMLIRQNNVLWVTFIPILVYIESYGISLSFHKVFAIIKKTWVYFTGIGLFVLFVILNKGIAVGDASSHPSFAFSTGNLFFLLFCFFVLFLPIHIANIPKIIQLLKKGKRPLILSVCFILVYWFTFKNNHPYNNISPEYFIRNYILMHFTSSAGMKALFLLPILFTFWSLMVTKLSRRSWYLFYIFTVLFLLPSWLIEQRYYIIPFALFMLFREEQSLKTERINAVYYLALLCFIIPLAVSSTRFL